MMVVVGVSTMLCVVLMAMLCVGMTDSTATAMGARGRKCWRDHRWRRALKISKNDPRGTVEMSRLCEACFGPLHAGARRDARTCSDACRQRKHRAEVRYEQLASLPDVGELLEQLIGELSSSAADDKESAP
jgi:hypothetical protein